MLCMTLILRWHTCYLEEKQKENKVKKQQPVSSINEALGVLIIFF